MRDNGFKRAQAFYEAQQPPEYDYPLCPVCGSFLDDGKCEDDYAINCEWATPGPDFEKWEDDCD